MHPRIFAAATAFALLSPAAAGAQDTGAAAWPTTVFADDARTATVTAGDITASVTMERRPDDDPDVDVPVLRVMVAGKQVLESVGVASDDGETPAATASIAEMDPGNAQPEVYFASFNGGCCSTVIVAEEVDGAWTAVPVGDFDGEGDYLADLDGDGSAEIATIDASFINRFDCTACSAAPRKIYAVKAGDVADVTLEPRFQSAHRDWLKKIEDTVAAEDKWSSRGFLAGWLAEKIIVGEGAAAWQEITAHWDLAKDAGEPTCPDGGEPGDCAEKDRKVLKFPEQLRLFLATGGYKF